MGRKFSVVWGFFNYFDYAMEEYFSRSPYLPGELCKFNIYQKWKNCDFS